MLITAIVIMGGLIVGWIATLVLRASSFQQVVLNLIMGPVSAYAIGTLFPPLFGYPYVLSGEFSSGTVIISLAGSALMLVLIDAARRFGLR